VTNAAANHNLWGLLESISQADYDMGGTIAETSVGQVSLSGLAALLHTTQTTLRTD